MKRSSGTSDGRSSAQRALVETDKMNLLHDRVSVSNTSSSASSTSNTAVSSPLSSANVVKNAAYVTTAKCIPAPIAKKASFSIIDSLLVAPPAMDDHPLAPLQADSRANISNVHDQAMDLLSFLDSFEF